MGRLEKERRKKKPFLPSTLARFGHPNVKGKGWLGLTDYVLALYFCNRSVVLVIMYQKCLPLRSVSCLNPLVQPITIDKQDELERVGGLLIES